MSACPACGAEGASPTAPCAHCGAPPAARKPAAAAAPDLPDLELDVPRTSTKTAAAAKKAPEPEARIELAVDLLAGKADYAPGNAARVPVYGGTAAPLAKAASGRHVSSIPVGTDVPFDARLLADYGTPPESWLKLPFYAWRVIRRQGELKTALEGRRSEAERTERDAEDAYVAFAQRVRAAMEADAEKASEFAGQLIELRKAEDVLRSRDSVLASEQDAHNARLAAVAVRLAKLEEELAQAQAAERKIAIELATAQAAISREETKLKRVEAELRAAQRRQESGDGDAAP